MHKKLAGDLTSLAHSILQMKNKEDVFALREKAHEIYEKLSVLAYVEEYINNTPNPSKTKQELLEEIEAIEETKIELVSHEEEIIEKGLIPEADTEEEALEELKDSQEEDLESSLDLFDQVEETVTENMETEPIVEVSEVVAEEGAPDSLEEETIDSAPASEDEQVSETLSLEEELQDTLAVDVAADLFETAPKKSLNDQLQQDIQIGLNDRIAFVKNLFEGSQEDFNRVVSQLNTFKSLKEANKFLNKMVKPDYDWTDKEEVAERFMAIVERKFA